MSLSNAYLLLPCAAGKKKAGQGLKQKNTGGETALASTDRVAPTLRLILATFIFYTMDSIIWTGETFFRGLTNTETPLHLRVVYLLVCPVLGFFAGGRSRFFLRVFYPVAAFFLVLAQALHFTRIPVLDAIIGPASMIFALGVFLSLPFILLDLALPPSFFYTAVALYIPCWIVSLFSAAFISRIPLDHAGSMLFLSLILALFLLLVWKDRAPTEKAASAPDSVINVVRDAPIQQEAFQPDSRQRRDALYKERNLTTREVEIAELLLQGCPRHNIADTLFVSHWTVNSHIRNLYQKLNVSSLTGFFALFRDA
jgi:DNA-binding CsgD family transcriptional regulator